MKDQISLYLTNGTWIARFHGQHGDAVLKMFGTRDIPTAFTAQTLGTTVQAKLGRLNPNMPVYLATTEGNA